MADPLWLADVLRAEGLRVDEFPGWRTRGEGDFGTIWGVVAHHTGSNPPSNNPGYIAQHPSLGLASQIHISRDGVVTICGVGLANHAGRGSWAGIARDNANAVTIGIEAENNGTEGWSTAQYTAYVKTVAAILRRLGHDASRCIAHWEWAGAAQGKWDPGGMDMPKFRRDIQAQIDNEGDAPLSAAEVKQIQDFVAGFCGPIGSDVKDIREQLAGQGQRDKGQYKGWPQLDNKTVVDFLADLGKRIAKLEGK
ncbi:N-acetylmuramoyl-L-alanine amidase [Nocardia sp. NPDC055002]